MHIYKHSLPSPFFFIPFAFLLSAAFVENHPLGGDFCLLLSS